VADLCEATAAAALEDPYHQVYVSVMSDEMLDDHLQDEHVWMNGNVLIAFCGTLAHFHPLLSMKGLCGL
jgi:hypothetical protein